MGAAPPAEPESLARSEPLTNPAEAPEYYSGGYMTWQEKGGLMSRRELACELKRGRQHALRLGWRRT